MHKCSLFSPPSFLGVHLDLLKAPLQWSSPEHPPCPAEEAEEGAEGPT